MADFRGYMIGSFASSRLDRGGIPVVATPVTVSNAGVIVNKTPIVDKVGAHMTGQDITTPVASGDPIVGAYTEHLVYYNKCTGVFRMLGQTATATTAPSA